MAATGKRKKRSWAAKFFLALNFLFAALLLICYATPYISHARYWLFAFFGLAYPVLLAVNLLFILGWTVAWRKYVWISLAIVFFGINHILSYVQFHLSMPDPAPERAVKVLSFNVHNLYGTTAPRKKDNRVFPGVLEFLGRQKPDILAIQELDIARSDSCHIFSNISSVIQSGHLFYKNYYETVARKRINALVIFSRYPIVRNGYFRLNQRNVFGIFTDLMIRGDTVRVYNLHLESFHFGREDYSFYEQLTEQESEQFRFTEGSKKIFSKLKKAFIIRAEQTDVVRREIDSSPYPVIVLGDFNDTPVSYTYREMTRKLSDAYKKAGQGVFGSTFAGNFPSFRIDYILFDEDFRAHDYQRYNVELSDHYPVSVSLDLNP